MAVVEVHPVAKEAWHGKTPDQLEPAPFRVPAYFNSRKMKYEVDMSEKELADLGKILGFDLSTAPSEGGKPHPFYDNPTQGAVVLQLNEVTTFNTDLPADRLRLAILRANPQAVGNTEDEAHDNDLPFYIYDSQKDVKAKANRLTRQNRLRVHLSTLGTPRLRSFVWAVLQTPCDDISEVDLIVKQEEMVTDHLAKAEKLMAQTQEHIEIMATVMRAVDRGYLRQSPSGFYHGSEKIGDSLEVAANWLSSPRQQDILLNFREINTSVPALGNEISPPDDAGVPTPDE